MVTILTVTGLMMLVPRAVANLAKVLWVLDVAEHLFTQLVITQLLLCLIPYEDKVRWINWSI